jgi:hypothetical protein
MAGQRQPGSWGLEPTAAVIDEGTSILFETPPPGPVGGTVGAKIGPEQRPSPDTTLTGIAADAISSLNDAVASFRRSESWAKLQPIVFQVVGHQSFGLGVVYGIGENVIGSVVELAQLAKTFLLADLYDRAHQSSLSAAFGPFAAVQRLMAEIAMRTFGSELEAARIERDELIAEVRHAITNLGEVTGAIKDSYVNKWNRFETLSPQRTLSSQFEAGRIFGEVLLEVVSLIAGGAAIARTAAKLPRLARLARLRIPAKSAPRGTASAKAVGEKPAVTPSQARGPEAPVAEPPPPKAPPKSTASALAGSEFNGIKAERIRPGSDTKVAVVGRNMEALDKYAQGLKNSKGIEPELFTGNKISPAADADWAELKRTFAPDRVPDDIVRQSQMFRENQAWAQKLADQGYTVVDIGNPTHQGLSPFYEMEKAILFPAK